MTKQKAIMELRIPEEGVHFMEAHADRAAECINGFLESCQTDDDRLGALGVLLHVTLAAGNAIHAIAQGQTKGTMQ